MKNQQLKKEKSQRMVKLMLKATELKALRDITETTEMQEKETEAEVSIITHTNIITVREVATEVVEATEAEEEATSNTETTMLMLKVSLLSRKEAMNPEEVEEAVEVAVVAEAVTEAEAEAKSEETTSMLLLKLPPLKLKNEPEDRAPTQALLCELLLIIIFINTINTRYINKDIFNLECFKNL